MEKLEKGPWEINWEKMQKLGILKYSSLTGLAFGLAPFVIKKMMELGDNSFSEVFLNIGFVAGAVTAFIAGFVALGLLTWYVKQYWYRRALRYIAKENSKVENSDATKILETNDPKMELNSLEESKDKELIAIDLEKQKNNRFNS